MAIATDKVQELHDLAEEVMDAADELVTAREDRSDYDDADRQDALEVFESAVRTFVDSVPPYLKR